MATLAVPALTPDEGVKTAVRVSGSPVVLRALKVPPETTKSPLVPFHTKLLPGSSLKVKVIVAVWPDIKALVLLITVAVGRVVSTKYLALSATATNLTVTYTNTTPTGSRTSVYAHPVTANYGAIGKILPHGLAAPYFTLQTGDVGITSVQSVQSSVALAAGVLGLYLHKPLVYMPGVPTDLYVERELTSSLDGLLELVTTSGGVLGCPMLSFISNTASTSVAVGLHAWMRTVRG